VLLPIGRLANTKPRLFALGRSSEGEEMRAARLQELEETAAKLLEMASKLPAGQDRHNALREIGRFRARITDLQRQEMRSTDRGLKAKGK
jgi:hypothetical protein